MLRYRGDVPVPTHASGEPIELHVPGARQWLTGFHNADLDISGYHIPSCTTREWALSEYVLMLCVRGQSAMRRRAGGREEAAEIATGDLLFNAPGRPACWSCDEPIDLLAIAITPSFLRRIAAEEFGVSGGIGMHDSMRIRDDAITRMIADAVDELAAERRAGWQRIVRAIGERITIQLLRRHFDLRAAASTGTFDAAEIAALRALVSAELGEDLRVSKMARAVGLGEHHFTRVFRHTFGQTPHQFLLAARLEKAHELVVRSFLSVGEIAALTGFADQSHLSRAFKGRFGVPPMKLRGPRS